MDAGRGPVATVTTDDIVKVGDSVGNQVTLIKDLPVRGAGQTLKRGTVIKSIRLTGNPQEIDCNSTGSKGRSCAPSSSASAEWAPKC